MYSLTNEGGFGALIMVIWIVVMLMAIAGASDALDGVSVDGSDFNSDLHASAEYRAHLVTVMAKRAVAALS